MRNKRRCEKVNFNLPDYTQENIEKKYATFKIIGSILNASDGIEQLNFIKEIESYLLQNDIPEHELEIAVTLLCTIFYQAPSKSSHKKALNRTIQEVSKKHPVVVETCLFNSINIIFDNMAVEEIEKPVLHVIYLVDNLHSGKNIVNKSSDTVWKFSSTVLKIVVAHLKQGNNLQKMNEYYSVCQNVLKLIIHCIQNCDNLKHYLKSNVHDNFQASSTAIINCLEYLLSDEETRLNCRLNAAFAYCNYYYFSFGEEKVKEMLSESNIKFPLVSKLCIFSSIMAVFLPENFVQSINGYRIADVILQETLDISKNSDSSEILILCSRNILQWTNVIEKVLSNNSVVDKSVASNISFMFSEDTAFMKILFEYVLHIRGHFIDSLRHLSKDIFRNILNLHILSCKVEPNKSDLLKEITLCLLNDLPPHNRGKYGMLCCIVEKIGTECILEWDPSLPTELYKALEESSLVSHISEFYQVLFSSSVKHESDKDFQNIWLIPLLEVLCKGSKEQTCAITEHILPKLLNVKPTVLTFLLSELSSMWENDLGNSFSALVTCMKLYQKEKGALSYLEFLSTDSLAKGFFHADDQVRLSAFALLCESSKTTEPLNSDTFELIKSGLHYNINCQSPPFRQQLISYMKKLFIRMFESGYALMKKQLFSDTECRNVLPKVMLPTVYQEFLIWLKNYLFSCLYPGANFPRRVTSLNLLYLLHETFSQSVPTVDSEVAVQTLIYSLQDTYDNNRLLALKLLNSELSLKLKDKGEILFSSALKLASSTKPPDTATAAYLFAYIVQNPNIFQHIVKKQFSFLALQDSTSSLVLPDTSESNSDFHLCTITMLMLELNKQAQFAKKSLLQAAACAPMYGILTCIRNVLNDVKDFKQCNSQWQLLIKELVTLSFNVAFIVEPIVCNSSPEGHLPMDTDNESIAQLQAAVRRALGSRFQSAVVQEDPSLETDSVVLDIVKSHAVTAQILLLCCWRTHKEISLLFGDIIEKVPLFDSESSTYGVLCLNQIKDIGNYFLHQMSLVKHRGAFEQAHVGFSKVCNRLWRSDLVMLQKLPKVWLEDIMLAIKGLKNDIQLCPTRRSAGLPFIIQAILASEPYTSNSSFFRKSMLCFLSLADPSNANNLDVQVHALNVLRALFRDASLGEAVMPFVSEGLKISIKGFKSSFWAVRNSSTLLFSALMTRVFGVNRSHDETGKKNRLTGKSFYLYYKEFYFFLIDELKLCVCSLLEDKTNKISIQPSLYPILLVLGRLYPAPGEEDTILSVFIPYLQICTSSPVWKNRVLAAKAMVSFTPHEKFLSSLESLIIKLNVKETCCQNEIHGEMLQILYLMEEVTGLPDFEKTSLRRVFESTFENSFNFYVRLNSCASTKAAFLQIYLFAMILNVEPDSCMIEWLSDELNHPYTDPDKDNYLALASVILFLKKLQLHDSDSSVTNSNSQSSQMDIITYLTNSRHLIIKYTVVEILLWLLQADSKEYRQNAESSDDIVIVQRVMKIVTLLDKRKYNTKHLLGDAPVESLVNMLECTTDLPLLRQLYKLLSIIPSSLEVQWKFLKPSNSYDLIKKFEYVLNSIESYSRDDVTSELLVYSTYLLAKLCEEYEFSNEEEVLEKHVDIITKWLEMVEECTSPDSSILLRKTVICVIRILVDKVSFPKSKLLGSSNLWQALLLLLVDDEPEIKLSASEIIVKMKITKEQGNSVLSAVPSKAVDLLVEMFIESNGYDTKNCISMLIGWMLSSNSAPLEFMSDEQPFDKGELNVFSEDLSITNIVSHHLSLYLTSQNSSKDNQILTQNISCWSHKEVTSLTFSEAIILCLSEANSYIENFLTRAAVSPLLDMHFDQELIHISQRVAVVIVLLPFSEVLPSFSVLCQKILKNIQSLDFRTFFIDSEISKIQYILDQL